MSDEISQKQYDCDHHCTYDSNRPRMVCKDTPDGRRECESGYRSCVDECMEDNSVTLSE